MDSPVDGVISVVRMRECATAVVDFLITTYIPHPSFRPPQKSTVMHEAMQDMLLGITHLNELIDYMPPEIMNYIESKGFNEENLKLFDALDADNSGKRSKGRG